VSGVGLDHQQLARDVVRMAMEAGASAAEVIVRQGSEFSAAVRMGSIEKLLQANPRKLGVRLFCDSRAAIAATSDFSPDTLRGMVGDAIAMARVASPDAAAGLPGAETYSAPAKCPELYFPAAQQLEAGSKIALAQRAEQAALGHDPRINNSEGAGFADKLVTIAYANSLGAGGSYPKTTAELYASPLAELDGGKQRDHWLSTGLDLARLESPEAIGARAATRVLRRLGGRKAATGEVPVVFDPLSAARVLSHLAEAVSGTALLRKASFLLDKLGTRIAPRGVHIVDDALLQNGLGSRPFDSEGVPSRATRIVDDGILVGYLLDSYSARKLGMQSTASSTREPSGAARVGPSNFFLEPGSLSPEEIIGSVRNGLYVTELIGFGVNIVSGNFSQGATGLWISNGELAYAVEEITVAGNLTEMLLGIEAIGNDPVAVSETFAPTVKIGKMVVRGN
jgi:PmbA protein